MRNAKTSLGEAPANDRQFVIALARGLQILSCFSASSPELTGSELARLTGLPQPTVWRLCYTMLELGMLIRTSGEKMRPGLSVLRLGHSALAGLDTIALARPHLQEIAVRYRGACNIAMCQGLDMVIAERCEGPSQLLMNLKRGSVLPIANSGLGWAWLAGLPDGERAQLIAAIEHNPQQDWSSSRKAFKAALAGYRRDGFIINEAIFHPDYTTVAVPVFDRHGKVYCALNCGAPSSTLSPKRMREEVGPALVNLARLLESSQSIS